MNLTFGKGLSLKNTYKYIKKFFRFTQHDQTESHITLKRGAMALQALCGAVQVVP